MMAGLPPAPCHSHLPKVSLGFLTAWRPQQVSQHDCPRRQGAETGRGRNMDSVSDIVSHLPYPMNQNRSCPTGHPQSRGGDLDPRLFLEGSISVYVTTFNPPQTEFHCGSFHLACPYHLFRGICLALYKHGGYLCAYFSVKREKH